MSDVNIYTFEADGIPGSYVDLDDYAALEAENARLRAEQGPVAFKKPSVLKECNVRYSTSTTPQPSAVPDGWKLVPVEPTPEMLSEFKRAYKDGDFWRERIHGAVCAMLAAAPSAPKADPAKVQLLEALEKIMAAPRRWYGLIVVNEEDEVQARAAIAAARKGEGE